MTKRPRGTGSIYRQPGSNYWWIGYPHNERYIRESSGSTKKIDAESVLKQRLAAIQTGTFAGPEMDRILVEELAEDFLRDYRVNAKDVEFAERCWKHLKPFFGQMRAVRVTTDHINRYILHRRSEGAANATINRELAALKRMFNMAARSTPPKVLRAPSFPQRLKESAPRAGFLEDEQYRKLVEQNPPLWLRAMLAVAYSFGFRKNELLWMRVRQVDFLDRTLRLEPGTTKNGEGRIAPMTEEVYRLLSECVRGKGPNDFLFSRANGEPVRNFRGAWTKLTKTAGLPGLLFHDLRRSSVRNMVRRGVPERVAMAISGHKSRSVFDRYNIVSESDIFEAARRIEQRSFIHSSFIVEPQATGAADVGNGQNRVESIA